MTLFQSIILGIIQGASEFLPISSSGHLVLAPYLFGWEISTREAFVFDVLVQVATLSAVIIYYWKDLVAILKAFFQGILNKKPFEDNNSKMGWYLVLATIPAGLAALLFKDTFEEAFSNPKSAALFLLITSVLLIFGELLGKRVRKLETITWLDAFVIGLFQVLALFPGISRSGSTISGGLLRKFDRGSAARFSFLMAVPVMSAAGVLAVIDLAQSPELFTNIPVYLGGFLTSAIVGYFAIRWFIGYLSKQSLYIFAGYCALLGSGFLVYFSL
jgi:undecaprenyl-diphosphatase